LRLINTIMSLLKKLEQRSDNTCELCGSKENLTMYQVPPSTDADENDSILICQTCSDQIENPDHVEVNHWRCLNDSMWSEVTAVQVVAWRMLTRLKSEGWPQDLLDMMYLDEENLAWAKATGEGEVDESQIIHRDVNGVVLQAGDSVVLELSLLTSIVLDPPRLTPFLSFVVKLILDSLSPKPAFTRETF